jgi:hypothetical protein
VGPAEAGVASSIPGNLEDAEAPGKKT